MELKGKNAIITGAAAGIGRASAVAMAEAGAATIVLADIDEAGLQATAELVAERQVGTLVQPVDVTDRDALTTLFANAEAELGGVDVVYNNAGIMCGDPQWPATTLEKIETVVAVNLTAVMLGTRLALDALARRGGGVVVNTASVAAFGPMMNDPVYSSTKAAVVNFTQACAPFAESHNVRVNAVLPGVVETAILAKSGDGEQPAEWLRPMLELVTKLEPSDIASAVLQLIADDTRVGESLVVSNPPAPGEPHSQERLTTPDAFFEFARSWGVARGAD